MKLIVVVLLLCACGSDATSRETFRGRLNSRGTQIAENMMRSMIRKVNDLIKRHVKLNRMQIGPVSVEGFSIRTLDTAQVTILMDRNRMGLSLANGRVHLTAQLAVYIPIFIGRIRIAGQFDTYGDGIQASLSSGISVSGGHLNANGMNCNLRVDRPRVDLHNGIINHFANMILQGVMPGVTQGVCNGVKQFGTGMANSIFKAIPTNVNVFNLFRLEFPVVNFRSWSRHMVGGIGMEVRPVSNRAVSNAGLRIISLPEAEDGHMACVTVSDYVINTASRTFLPAGKSFTLNVASVLNLLVKDLFPFAIFIRGTIVSSPMFLVENGMMVLSVNTKGVMTDKNGKPIAGTEIKPTVIKVSCPTNETPMFSKVQVQMTGAFNMKITVNIANIIDMIIGYINTASAKYGQERAKRATTRDLANVLNKMFFSKWFSGFSMRLQAKHGAVLVCMSGSPNASATNKIYGLLRSSFYRG